jgi:hypothetical protein
MFIIVFGWLKTKVLSNASSLIFIAVLLGIVSVIVIPSCERIKGFFGYDTVDTLKAKLDTERLNNQFILSSNVNLEKTLAITEQSSLLTIDIIKEQDSFVNKTSKNLNTVLTAKTIAIEKIKVKYAAKVTKDVPDKNTSKKPQVTKKVNTTTPDAIETELSKVQIDSIWEVYNDATSTHPQG